MPPVMVVTDSTAYLPLELVASHPIRIIPLTAHWEGQSYRDGVDIRPTEFYTRLSRSKTLPSTSQISTGEWSKNINELREADYDVLMPPISSGISGTYQTAVSAVMDFPSEVSPAIGTHVGPGTVSLAYQAGG